MNVQEQINDYIADQPQPKSEELRQLHRLILSMSPDCKLTFSDGRNSEDKVVSNPNIGYGLQTIRYADGETREFYRVGLSANTTGISVYIMDTKDKQHLRETYGEKLGKAKVTGYCIKFRSIKDTNLETLEEIFAKSLVKGSASGS
jgi:hypothetical protein